MFNKSIPQRLANVLNGKDWRNGLLSRIKSRELPARLLKKKKKRKEKCTIIGNNYVSWN